MEIVLTAVLSALLGAAVMAVVLVIVWRRVLLPELERRAQTQSDQWLDQAQARLQAEADVQIPRFRAAVRDGIQDALLTPPGAGRITESARGVSNAGAAAIENGLRRLLGLPSKEDDPRV